MDLPQRTICTCLHFLKIEELGICWINGCRSCCCGHLTGSSTSKLKIAWDALSTWNAVGLALPSRELSLLSDYSDVSSDHNVR